MNIAILGTGAYGIALSLVFHDNNCHVKMWTKFEEEKDMLISKRQNNQTLPNILIPSDVYITTDMHSAVSGADLVVVAVPAGVVASVSNELKNCLDRNQHICIASKGIEQETCSFVYDILTRYIDSEKIAVISGPSFAIDIARRCPIGLTLATCNKETEELIVSALQNDYLKLRVTDDIVGVEICGAIKNVIAIAAGIIDGMNFPESTQAMFITESLNDIKSLIHALGGDKNTILSFAGFGDLLLTATSPKSRNYRLGYLIGSRTPQEKIDYYIKTTTIEGLYTLKSIYQLLQDREVDMPIINLIYDIIYKHRNINDLIKFLIEKN